MCAALKSARSGLFVSCAHFFLSLSLSVVVLFTTLAHSAPKHTDVHVHVCVCVCGIVCLTGSRAVCLHLALLFTLTLPDCTLQGH